MVLEKVLDSLEYKIIGNEELLKTLDIAYVEFDSRRVSLNVPYFALVRGVIDGHEYIDSAIENGAKVIIIEKDVEFKEGILYIKVSDANYALAKAASNLYNNPVSDLKLIGVTGTNGKTTITSLIERCLKKLGKKVGLIGTMEIHIGDEVIEAKNTTPFSNELQEIFSKMRDASTEYVSMEVCSHALSLKRDEGCNYEIGIYTNLTQDHLDFHHTMDEYKEAKLKLFKKSKNSIINTDTPYSDFYIENASGNVITYGINKEADFRATNEEITIGSSKFDLLYKGKSYPVHIATPGEFSIYNALAVIAALVNLGYEVEEVARVVGETKGVTGRFQTFMSHNNFSVIVDYAHTPDGLLNILETAKKFAKGRIITVFGCGGDRDTTKRPIMGKIAMEYSDFVVVTSDNPRTEEPYGILDDIEVGVKEVENCNYTKLIDRYEATKFAIDMAKESDIVILAGKGHEEYQIIGHEKIHYSDIEVVRELI